MGESQARASVIFSLSLLLSLDADVKQARETRSFILRFSREVHNLLPYVYFKWPVLSENFMVTTIKLLPKLKIK